MGLESLHSNFHMREMGQALYNFSTLSLVVCLFKFPRDSWFCVQTKQVQVGRISRLGQMIIYWEIMLEDEWLDGLLPSRK